MSIDARIKILYILLAGVAVFLSARSSVLLGLLGAQLLLWVASKLPLGDLLRSIRKLSLFLALIVVSFAFFGREPDDSIQRLALPGFELPLNLTGTVRGLLRASRVVTVVLAAQIVQRTTTPAEFVAGLRALRVPASLAYGLDLVLSGLGPSSERGAGRGRGRGRGRRRDESSGFGFKRLLRGDVGFVADRIERQFRDVRVRASVHGLEPAMVDDLVRVAGLTLVAMSVRFLQVMPGLPVAPGHKGILLIPLYVLAHSLTRSRWGSTQFGVVMGVTSFLLGMGKFGPFDILRHAAPGLFVDLAMPVVVRVFRRRGPLVYGIVGVGAAVTRLSAMVAVALIAQAPTAFFAVLVPTAVAHVVFGGLSGFVTFYLMRLVPGTTGEPLRESDASSVHDRPAPLERTGHA